MRRSSQSSPPAQICQVLLSRTHISARPHPPQSRQFELNPSTAPNYGIKRNSSVGTGLYPSSTSLHRQSTLGPPPVKKRLSGLGAISSHARLYKVYGDFFLLAGRTQDAQIWSVIIGLCPETAIDFIGKVSGGIEPVQGWVRPGVASVRH